MEKSHYISWAELFQVHCKAYKVYEHLTDEPPSSSKSPSTDKDSPPKVTDELWLRLDAIVLQWIYSTISIDLLHTILETDSTAKQAWHRLKSIFHDNQNSRAVYLEHQFFNTKLDNFPNASAYCQELKMLSDQLANVVSPDSNQRLVLQMISDLNESYDGVATIIQQSNPLPMFYEARSKVCLKETRKASQATTATAAAGTALVTTSSSDNKQKSSSSAGNSDPQRTMYINSANRGGLGGANRGRGRGTSGRGRGRGNYNNSNYWGQNSGQYNGPRQPSWNQFPPWFWSQWSFPPCPYPIVPQTQPNNSNGAPVFLVQGLNNHMQHQPLHQMNTLPRILKMCFIL